MSNEDKCPPGGLSDENVDLPKDCEDGPTQGRLMAEAGMIVEHKPEIGSGREPVNDVPDEEVEETDVDLEWRKGLVDQDVVVIELGRVLTRGVVENVRGNNIRVYGRGVYYIHDGSSSSDSGGKITKPKWDTDHKIKTQTEKYGHIAAIREFDLETVSEYGLRQMRGYLRKEEY